MRVRVASRYSAGTWIGFVFTYLCMYPRSESTARLTAYKNERLVRIHKLSGEIGKSLEVTKAGFAA